MKKKLLVIEPHSDDGMIAAGGLCRHLSVDYEISFCLVTASALNLSMGFVTREQRMAEFEEYVTLYDGSWVRPDIDGDSLPLDYESRLDRIPKARLVSFIEKSILAVKPDVLITTGPSFHHDHTAVYESVIAATRPTARFMPKLILISENPTYVHEGNVHLTSRPNFYFPLTEDIMSWKIDKFEDIFKSQIRPHENYLSSNGIKRWASYRGLEARCDYAEAFFIFSMVGTQCL